MGIIPNDLSGSSVGTLITSREYNTRMIRHSNVKTPVQRTPFKMKF